MVYDVALIGAGLMGLSTAYWLNKNSKLKIAMIDRMDHIGGHSTTRCSGGIRYQYSNRTSILMSKYNKELIDAISKDESMDFCFNKCGYTFVVTNSKKEEEYLEAVKLQHDCGIDTLILEKNDVKKWLPQFNFSDVSFVTYCRSEGRINVNNLLSYLRDKIHNQIDLYIGTEVKRIQKKDGLFNVLVGNRVIKSVRVVNSAGPWANEIAHMLHHELYLDKSKQIVLLTNAFERIPRNLPMVIFPDIGIGFHEESGGILFQYYRHCEKSTTDDMESDYSWVIKSIRNAVMRFPSMNKALLASRWVGYYDETADGLPIIGESNAVKGLFNICGFNGHGFMHGLIAGKILADIIMEKYNCEFDLTMFSDKRSSLADKKELYRV